MKDTLAIWMAAALCVGMLGGGRGWADTLAVGEAKLPAPGKGGVQTVRCDVQWGNSWRNDLAGEGNSEPHNYDAAWMFMKFRSGDGRWRHATLSTKPADHQVPKGVALSVGQTDGKGVGVFIYRNANGMGKFTANDVGLCWQRAADGVAEGAAVTVRVFALEMVQVPQGAFWVGDRLADAAQFSAGGSGQPFKITGEAEIAVGPGAGQLNYSKLAGGGDQAGPVPAAFPKGYAAFYGMKYELTQAQYVDYLNILTAEQAAEKVDLRLPGMNKFWSRDMRLYGIKQKDGVYETSLPLKACGFFRYADLAAYLDWAGLRPLTELEFEKACRGPLTPVAGEFAWGDTKFVVAAGLANEGTADERPNNFEKANLAWDQCGMIRVGCLGVGTNLRHRMGAGYYGMMELSGSEAEEVVSVGHAKGREFTGRHGDGALSEGGEANVPTWPGRDGVGFGIRGGGSCGWSAAITTARISDRSGAASGGRPDTDGHVMYGMRGCRTAP